MGAKHHCHDDVNDAQRDGHRRNDENEAVGLFADQRLLAGRAGRKAGDLAHHRVVTGAHYNAAAVAAHQNGACRRRAVAIAIREWVQRDAIKQQMKASYYDSDVWA